MNEMNPFLVRLNALLDYYGLKQASFCKRVGVSLTTINSLYARNAEPSYKTCVAILNNFNDVSAEWLMRGQGEMIKSNQQVVNSNINNGDVSGNLTQVVMTEDVEKKLAKIKMMLRGCLDQNDYELIAEEINKVSSL